jgi:formylglycine-generating enzyme required for sulfatase activity
MIWVPAGQVNDGSDVSGPVASGFWMSSTEVTQKQFRLVTGESPSFFNGDNLPVDSVSFGDCRKFCKKLSKKEGRIYAVPTVLQWKLALLAGGDHIVYNGFKEKGWLKGPSSSPSTKAVALKTPNSSGFYDMIGNVAEWTDTILLQISGLAGGGGKVSGFICSGGSVKELMKKNKAGGSVNTRPADLKANFFVRSSSNQKDRFTGFRVICMPKPTR